MESFSQVWDSVCQYCRETGNLSDIAYSTWVECIKPVSLDFGTGVITLQVPTDFHRNLLIKSYNELFNEAFMAILGSTFTIEYITDQQQLKKSELLPPVQKDDYEFTFDTFIVGSSNKFAHAAAIAVAEKPAMLYNPLFIYGNPGLGKTHLLYAIAKAVGDNNPNAKIVYVKGDDFTNELIESLRMARMSEFRKKYRQADILLVDDVQFIGGKESTQEEFFHTFNALYDAHKQIVLTSDRPPKEIKTLDDRLRSRFESDLIADVQPPDVETRIAIIKRKAELLDLDLSNEVCEYIASKIKANIRQLEGTVKKLKAKNLVNQEKITVSSVQEVISDILNNDTPPEVTVERIIEEVSRTFGVTPEAIRSENNRSANISNARHIAIYISRELTTLSMANIGEEFGGRHYSTVIYTVKKVKKMMQNDRKIKEIIDDTIKNIRDR